MAFNKIWVALALMLAVATIADARSDLSQFVKKKENDASCYACECENEGSCKCTHRAVGGCPSSCIDDACLCTRSIPPICWCSTVVDACPASKYNAINNQLQFIRLPQTPQY